MTQIAMAQVIHDEVYTSNSMERQILEQGIIIAQLQEELRDRTEKAAKLAKLKARPLYVPTFDNPKKQLILLVKHHRALTRSSVALEHMASDRKKRDTGEIIKCALPECRRTDLLEASAKCKSDANKLKVHMEKELNRIPIYQVFLSKVSGVGPVTAAYLVTQIDIHKCVKPSQLRMFCGLAVDPATKHIHRPTKGQKLRYSTEMRTILFQCLNMGMRMTKRSNKYTKVWDDYTQRQEVQVGMGERKKVNKRTGWIKAADMLIHDLYTVWRAIEQLPVWPSYGEGMRGYLHGGGVCSNNPEMLTIEAALSRVGIANKRDDTSYV